MYSQPRVEPQSHGDPYDAQEERLQLPAIFNPADDEGAAELFGLPVDAEYKRRRQAYEHLTPMPVSHLRVASVPTPPPNPFFLASPTSDDISEIDLSMSPAAMFLSSFSPLIPSGPLPDDEGETVCGYTLGPIIAYGGFSIIRRASSQEQYVAVKIVRHADIGKHEDPELAKKHLEHEAAVWSSLCHENILPLFASSHTSYADFFVTLYCPAGSLFDILKRDGRPGLQPDDASRMFRQVVKGLRYVHEVAGYVHGDMKLENVLVDEMGVCRITDFGMARKIGESESDEEDEDAHDSRSSRTPRTAALRPSQSLRQKRSRSRQPLPGALTSHLSLMRHHGGPRHRISSPFPTAAAPPASNQVFQPGSLPYASPELLLPSSSAAPYRPHPAQDIWALGVMLYLLLSGRLPFADSFEPRLQMKILHGAFDIPAGIGRGAERVLKGCIQRSVQDRWAIAMVDEVVEWGDGGDETSSPTDMLPPRSLVRNPPTVHENAVLDDTDTAQEYTALERRPSRSRSGRSRSRSTAYHPYIYEPHQPSHTQHDPMQPLLSGLSSSILRNKSSSSSSSSYSPPPDSALLVTPSTSSRSIERGRPARLQLSPSPFRSVSRSGSPPAMPLTPLDISAAYRNRGRKVSPRTARSTSKDGSLRRPSRETVDIAENDVLQLPSRWALSPNSEESAESGVDGNGSPSASYNTLVEPRKSRRQLSVDTGTGKSVARAESVPPPLAVTRVLSEFKRLSPSATPVSASGQMSTRSRSVGFPSDGPSRGRRA